MYTSRASSCVRRPVASVARGAFVLPVRPLDMTRDELLSLFKRSGALLEGHFRLSSGLHSSGYLQCALVLQYPADAEVLGRALAARVAGTGPTAVLSPALGGVVIGHEVARALGVRALFAERLDGVLTLRRGFALGASDRVVVVHTRDDRGGDSGRCPGRGGRGGRGPQRRDRRSACPVADVQRAPGCRAPNV